MRPVPNFVALDYLAVGVFLASWLSYHFYQEVSPRGRRSLNSMMNQNRHLWMLRAMERDGRIVDAALMGSLQNGAAFFASTSLIAIGGTLSALGATDSVMGLMASVPWTPPTDRTVFELKILGLAIIFVHSFFKLLWSYRLFNYAAILVGAMPILGSGTMAERTTATERASLMNISAGRHFNRGLRAFFYALAYLGWFAGPLPLIITSVIVTVVMWRRQFASDSLAAVSWNGEEA